LVLEGRRSTRSRAILVGRAALIPLMCLLLGACATQSGAPVRPGPQEPTLASRAQTGLGLPGPDISELLKTIAVAPYVPPDPMDCAGLDKEIAGLDQVLGPDVDVKAVPEDRGQQMQKAAGDALVGMVPYRGVVRWMTGAGALERDVLAAAARRGFLKGLRLAHACGPRDAH
jgi:hypothetical protein